MLEYDANDDHARLPGAGDGDAFKAGAPRPPIVRRRDPQGLHGPVPERGPRQQRPPARLARMRAAARGGCTRTPRLPILAPGRAQRVRRKACHGRPS